MKQKTKLKPLKRPYMPNILQQIFRQTIRLFSAEHREITEENRKILKRFHDPIFQLHLKNLRNNIEKEKQPQTETPVIYKDDPYAVLHLLPTAPFEVVEASFRQLSKIYHPDAGGNEQLMQRITWAYQTIKEQRLKNCYSSRIRNF